MTTSADPGASGAAMSTDDLEEIAAMLPLLLNVEDLASLTGLAPQTIHNMRARGRAPKAIKMGRRLKFPRQGVIAWLRERQI